MGIDAPLTSEDCCQAFADSYEVTKMPAMREIERRVLGCDYGGTSWTTRAQAELQVKTLSLRKGDHFLEIGSGSGWPALFVAGEIGCDVTLLDLPRNALEIAAERARNDGLHEQVSLVNASGSQLPFNDNSFDSITHSDVLCCLPDKIEMLEQCKRVGKDGAQMLFSVIYIPEGLSEEDHEKAIDVGPPFIDAPFDYESMLLSTGWLTSERIDVTDDHVQSLTALVDGLANSDELAVALGKDVIQAACDHRRDQIDAIEARLMVREIFVAQAA